jgi:hypothetical protein
VVPITGQDMLAVVWYVVLERECVGGLSKTGKEG